MTQHSKTWLCLAPAMVVPSMGTYLYYDAAQGTGQIQGLYLGLKLFLLLWPAMAVAWLRLSDENFQLLQAGFCPGAKSEGASDGRPSFWSKHSRALLPGFLLGLIMAGGLTFLFPVLHPWLQDSATLIRAKLAQAGIANHYLALALCLSTLHALLEEYYWRWFVYGRLRRVLGRAWQAHGLAALAFASHHWVVLFGYFPWYLALAGGGAVACAGMAWSWMYQRQGSLAGSFFCHLMVDLTIFGLAFRIIG